MHQRWYEKGHQERFPHRPMSVFLCLRPGFPRKGWREGRQIEIFCGRTSGEFACSESVRLLDRKRVMPISGLNVCGETVSFIGRVRDARCSHAKKNELELLYECTLYRESIHEKDASGVCLRRCQLIPTYFSWQSSAGRSDQDRCLRRRR